MCAWLMGEGEGVVVFHWPADSMLPSACEMGLGKKHGAWRVAGGRSCMVIKITFGGELEGPNEELQGGPGQARPGPLDAPRYTSWVI